MSLLALKDMIREDWNLILCLVFAALTCVQVAPIKINPWSTIFDMIGKALNTSLLKEISEVKSKQEKYIQKLEEHIKMDEYRYADLHRARILQFNTELIRGVPHTKEDFTEIFYNIDSYDKHCKENPDYPNSRATHAVANIERVYDMLLKDGGFLSADGN